MAYTYQLCKKCGKPVKLDFGWVLLHLDDEILCEKCKKEEKGGDKNTIKGRDQGNY